MSINLVLVELRKQSRKTKSGSKLKTERFTHSLIQTPTEVTNKAMSKIVAGNHDTQLLALEVYKEFLVDIHGYNFDDVDRLSELRQIIERGAFFEAQ